VRRKVVECYRVLHLDHCMKSGTGYWDVTMRPKYFEIDNVIDIRIALRTLSYSGVAFQTHHPAPNCGSQSCQKFNCTKKAIFLTTLSRIWFNQNSCFEAKAIER
jgi:hypothetical protein